MHIYIYIPQFRFKDNVIDIKVVGFIIYNIKNVLNLAIK